MPIMDDGSAITAFSSTLMLTEPQEEEQAVAS